MRELKVLADAGAEAVGIALRKALSGDGPAVLPLADAAPDRAAVPETVPKSVALVIQTSGSAGKPKLVALSANALLASAAATDAAIGGPGSWVLALPTHYIAGAQVLVRSIAAESAPVVIDPSFTAEEFAQAVEKLPSDRPRYTSLVPAQLVRLLDAVEGGDSALADTLQSLKAVLVGGQRLSEPLRERAAAANIAVKRTYGSSETSGGCIYDGVPLAGVETRIVDGELQVSGAMLAEGYLGDEERTASTFPVEGGKRWYRTGDAATIADGVVSVSGRLDDVIISGGEKVSLGLVESAVRRLPGLHNAVVVRAPHERWGEVPVVVTGGAPQLELAALREAVVAELGRAAAPDRCVALDSIPLLASGKPDRRAIAAAVAESP